MQIQCILHTINARKRRKKIHNNLLFQLFDSVLSCNDCNEDRNRVRVPLNERSTDTAKSKKKK